MLIMVCDIAGKFELTPLLDTLEGQHTHLNDSNVLDQHSIGEEEGLYGGI